MTSTMPRASGRRGQRPYVRSRWLALALLASAQLMLVLDVTVVNVALPDIGAALQVQSHPDIRQRHAHHRHVQDQHQLRGREQGQRNPARWNVGRPAGLTRSARHGRSHGDSPF